MKFVAQDYFILFFWSATLPASSANELFACPPVPGTAPSGYYKVCVRSASYGSRWQDAFAWDTVCKSVEKIKTVLIPHRLATDKGYKGPPIRTIVLSLKLQRSSLIGF